MRNKILAAFLALAAIFTIAFAPQREVKADANDVEGFVTRLYEVCLGREADSEGLALWTKQLQSKEATGCSIAYGFIFSNEFQSKNCTNEEYVTYMYSAFFGRVPDEGGLNTWVGFLNGGASRESVFCGFANSAEFSNLCNSYGIIRGYHVEGTDFTKTAQVNLFVNRLYSEVLGRECDEGGMETWTRTLVTGELSGAKVAYSFVFSPEFISREYCNEHYVRTLYTAFLGRAGDDDGINNWVSLLENGSSREDVFAGFVTSDEFVGICTVYGINVGSAKFDTKTFANGTCSICGRRSADGRTLKNGFYIEGEDNHVFYYVDDVIQNLTGWQEIGGNTYFFTKDPSYGYCYAFHSPYQSISGKYYCFNKMGELQRGWYKHSEKSTYYTNQDGVVQKGWQTIEGNKYYFGSDGRMTIGWKQIEGKYYFFDDNGVNRKKADWVDTGSSTIYIYEDGTAANGWCTIDGNRYYFLNSMLLKKTGWYAIERNKYYFFNDKYQWVKKTGWQEVNNKTIFYDESGEPKTGWIDYNGSRYYCDEINGRITGFRRIGNSKYYFDNNGALPKFNSWLSINGADYYCKADGSLATGWLEIGGKRYLFDDTGIKQTGYVRLRTWKINSSNQSFDEQAYNVLLGTDGAQISVPNGSKVIDGYTYSFDGNGHVTTISCPVGYVIPSATYIQVGVYI